MSGEDLTLGLCCVLSDLDFRSAPESRALRHLLRLDIHEVIEWVHANPSSIAAAEPVEGAGV